jgi:uncharacterized protein YecE (DUF72 family)
MIRIGTSGFSYEDWHGPFYPPSVRPQHRLEYYAQHFNTLEVNSTFYALPAVSSVSGMLRKVGDDFDFFVKGHRDLTHGTRKQGGRDAFEVSRHAGTLSSRAEAGRHPAAVSRDL